MGILNQIATYDLPTDYIKQRESVVQGMTLDEHRQLAQKHIRPDGMIYLVVGGAETQLGPLRRLGLGQPILLNTAGERAGPDITAK